MPSVKEARDTAARLYREGREAGYAEAAYEAILAVSDESPAGSSSPAVDMTREDVVINLALGALARFDDVASFSGMTRALRDAFYACPAAAGSRDA